MGSDRKCACYGAGVAGRGRARRGFRSSSSPATTGSKQGVDRQKARESFEQALAVAREAGLEESVRPLVEIRLADLERLARGSPPPARACSLTSCSAAAARAARFGPEAPRPRGAPSTSASSSSGSTSTPASGGTNSGGPPIRVATTERSHAIASRSAWPNGSISDGWQTTSAAAIQRGDSSCGTRPTTRTPGRPSSSARSGPSPTKASAALAEPLERVARGGRRSCARQRADAEERRARRRPSRAGARRVGSRGEALEVDAGVDDLGLARAPRAPSPRARGGGSRRRRRRRRRGGRRAAWPRAMPGQRADVADVAAVRGDDERRARRRSAAISPVGTRKCA